MHIIRFGTWLKQQFGERVHRVSLHAGMTCPNRDGTQGTGGCIFCDNGSFHPRRDQQATITDQMICGMERARTRYGAGKYLAYFQTFTNTYADVSTLRRLYEEAIAFDDVVGLMIGTRPDCLEPPVLKLLDDLSRRIMVWVELGVQTFHDSTLSAINRGHTIAQTVAALHALKNIPVKTAAHVILGLPGETGGMMMQTAERLAQYRIDGIKLHHLHAVRHTVLAQWFETGRWVPLKVDEYIDYAAGFLYTLPDGIVVMRLVADCPDHLLIAPRWAQTKPAIEKAILDRLDQLGRPERSG